MKNFEGFSWTHLSIFDYNKSVDVFVSE